MDKESIRQKFGREYLVNQDTFHMGIHHLLGEAIAKRFANHKVCLDACLGAGFMTINLAKYVEKVIGADNNPEHLKLAKQNTAIAGLNEKIVFVFGDVLEEISKIDSIDSAFLDPDWAKVGDNKENHVSSLSLMVPPADLLLEKVFRKTKNVCLRLPKQFDLKKLSDLPQHEIEAVYLDNKLKFYCIYFGDLVKRVANTEFRLSNK